MPALYRAAGLVGALVLLLALGAPSAVADTTGFTVSDDRITSPVGLATDADHSLYWTANSTPDTKKTSVFAVDGEGSVRAVLTYGQGTTGVLAIGYDAGNLYVLDKSPKASTLRLSYLSLTGLIVSGSLPYHFYELGLPETGQTMAALVVAPQKQFAVVTTQGRVYKGPAKPTLAGINRLTKVTSGAGAVTGGSYDATQKAVVLRTPDAIITADPSTFATRATVPVPAAIDGTGITRALDTQSYLLGKGNGKTLVAVSLTGALASPSASAGDPSSVSPRPSSTPSDTIAGTHAPTATGPTGELFGRATGLALGGALLLALMAGLIVAARR